MSKKTDRTGEIGVSNEGCVIKIVKYNDARDVIVEFQDEHKYRVHANYQAFKKGNVKTLISPQCLGMAI